LRQIIRGLGEAGKTVLVSSHILPELADICDSIGIMEHGRLLVSGPLDTVSALGASGRLKIRILHDRAAEVPATLAGCAAVQSVSVRDDEAEVMVAEGEEAVAEVFERLVQAGLRIGHVAQEENDLERLYLQLTHGELA
jgi:ABC-2 type transport system ATP-binding protein